MISNYDIYIIILSFLSCIIGANMLFRRQFFSILQNINVLNSLLIILLLVYFFKIGRSDFIDLVLIYGLLSHVSIIAIYKAFLNKKNKK